MIERIQLIEIEMTLKKNLKFKKKILLQLQILIVKIKFFISLLIQKLLHFLSQKAIFFNKKQVILIIQLKLKLKNPLKIIHLRKINIFFLI
jgi:hypothetical protein